MTSTGGLPHEPADEIDVIRKHVDHRRRVRIALEYRERLRARVVDARHAADDAAEALVNHLFLGAQEAFLETPAVPDAKRPIRYLERFENALGVVAVECDGFFDEDLLSKLERTDNRGRMLAFRR